MKKYLNREDREHHLGMLVLWDYVGSWVEKTNCLTKEEKKKLRTAMTNILHASDSIVARLDESYAQKLLRDIKNNELHLIDKVSRGRAKEKDAVNIFIDDLYDLANYALGDCMGCGGKDFKECERYKLFFKLNIPVAQEDTDDCPYTQIPDFYLYPFDVESLYQSNLPPERIKEIREWLEREG